MTHGESTANWRPARRLAVAATELARNVGDAGAARERASRISRRAVVFARLRWRAIRREAARVATQRPIRITFASTLAWLDARERASRPGRLAPPRLRVTLGASALTAACAVLLIAAAAIRPLASGLPGGERLTLPLLPVSLVLTDADQEILGRRGVYRDHELTYPELPEHVVQAVISIEDQRFFSHHGVDLAAIARALYANLSAGHIVEGGSTITQQLARNLFLTSETTLRRKIREAILAVRLESVLTKQQILEAYLNRIYFGAGAYGIEAAAETYFGKHAAELSLAEAALLAGLIKAPTAMSTGDDLASATARGRLVLQQMRAEGFISSEEYQAARLTLSLPRSAPSPVQAGDDIAPYLLDWVSASLGQMVDEPHGTLVAETTLDPRLQETAEHVLRRAIEANRDAMGVTQGAVVVLDSTGAVRAMVGGLDHDRSQFNRAVQARRQPGSAFKPFVYLTALERGLSPSDRWRDRPINIRGWRPENYGGRHRGVVTLDEALRRSINSVAVDLANRIGLEAVARTARDLGIGSPIRVHPSLALGTSEVTLLELTSAYAALANGGVATPAYAIRRVFDAEGRVVYAHGSARRQRVADPVAVGELNEMLTHVIERGTGRRAAIEGVHAAGKTGTNQDYRDAWFVGFTEGYTVGVWVGNDDFTPMNRVTGGSLPAEIWHEVMGAAIRDGKPAPRRDDEPEIASAEPVEATPPAAGVPDTDPFAGFGAGHIRVPDARRARRDWPWYPPGAGNAFAHRSPGDPFANGGAMSFAELSDPALPPVPDLRGVPRPPPSDNAMAGRHGGRSAGRAPVNDRGTVILLGRRAQQRYHRHHR